MRRRGSHLKFGLTFACALIAFSLTTIQSFGAKNVWQVGTILDVKAHQPESVSSDGLKQYDVDVKVGTTIYVVLHTPTKVQMGPEFYIGMNLTVLVDGKVLKYNDILGRPHTTRILSSRRVPPPKAQELTGTAASRVGPASLAGGAVGQWHWRIKMVLELRWASTQRRQRVRFLTPAVQVREPIEARNEEHLRRFQSNVLIMNC